MMRETRNVLRSLLLMTTPAGDAGMQMRLIREGIYDALQLYLFWDGSLELYSREYANQIIADPAEQLRLLDDTEQKQTFLEDIEAFRAMSRSAKRKRRGKR